MTLTLLWLIDRLHKSEPEIYRVEWYLKKLEALADYLISRISPEPCIENRRLIRMCAEADTRSRIHAYANNNLWAVNGLRAFSDMRNRCGRTKNAEYEQAAEEIFQNLRIAFDLFSMEHAVGRLVPFQIGYTAIPLTLSCCRDTSAPISDEIYQKYIAHCNFEEEIAEQQDYSENTYANYRYYLEMLSSGLMKREEEDAIVRFRETYGGEFLGMTRLYERLDDWTAENYARYLLTRDRIDKYLLLYYAHFYYHGNPEMGVYYEQVSLDGSVVAPDCVPSLLLIPIMTAWMFCFEPVHGEEIYLLKAIPKEWYASEGSFSARNLKTTKGTINISVTNQSRELMIQIHTEATQVISAFIDIRTKAELVEMKNAEAIQEPLSGRYFIKLSPHTTAVLRFAK